MTPTRPVGATRRRLRGAADRRRSRAVTTRRRMRRRRWSPLLVRLGSALTFLVLWESGWRAGILDARFYSSPTLIVRAGREVVADQDLLGHVATTGMELGSGWALGSSLAIVVGVLLGASPTLRKLFDPLLMALYVMPRLAIYPVLIVWLGIGVGSKIAMVTLGAFFLAVINVIAGVRAIPAILRDVATSFDLSPLQRFVKVTIPSALPGVATGLKQGWSQGVIAVITAEMYLSREGVGHLIMRYGQALQTDKLLFLVILVAAIAYLFIRALDGMQTGVFHRYGPNA